MDFRINALDDILSQLEQRYERVKSAVLQCIQYTNHIEKTRQTMLSVDSILSLKNDKYQEKFNSYRYKVDSIRTALENCIYLFTSLFNCFIYSKRELSNV